MPPPHPIKQSVIKKFQEKYQIHVFIETGTYLGDMIEAQRRYFTRLFSIELDSKLWEAANKRFEQYKHIKIVQGDSIALPWIQLLPISQNPPYFGSTGITQAGLRRVAQKIVRYSKKSMPFSVTANCHTYC